MADEYKITLTVNNNIRNSWGSCKTPTNSCTNLKDPAVVDGLSVNIKVEE